MRLSRLVIFALFLAFPVFSQENAPIGIVRGDLVEWDGEMTQGDILVRTPPDRIYTCQFDNHTYLERDGQRIGLQALKTGDHLELVADHKPGSQRCYARTIRVVEKTVAPVNPGYRVNLRRSNTIIDQIYPRGNLTFSGVIIRMTPQMMVVRTRTEGEKTILLRQDTRYMDSGLPAEISMLAVNTRVSIRGGKNLDNELEAYQVIWGQIEGPGSR
jgi:hypothetical protein